MNDTGADNLRSWNKSADEIPEFLKPDADWVARRDERYKRQADMIVGFFSAVMTGILVSMVLLFLYAAVTAYGTH